MSSTNFIAKMGLIKKYKSLPNLLNAISGQKIEDFHDQAKKKVWTTVKVKGRIDEHKDCSLSFHIRRSKNNEIEISGSSLTVAWSEIESAMSILEDRAKHSKAL